MRISILKWSFKLKNYEKLMQKDLNKLSSTAKYFFKFLYEFNKYKIEELLNKIFNTITRQNERILDAFILQHEIEFDGEDVAFSDYEME